MAILSNVSTLIGSDIIVNGKLVIIDYAYLGEDGNTYVITDDNEEVCLEDF
jgi:hypothetical protein